MRPYQRRTSATTAVMRPVSVTSSSTATARSGCAATSSWSVSGLRALATTVSPAARAAAAIDRPKPEDAPVISQTLPAASRVGVLSLLISAPFMPAVGPGCPRQKLTDFIKRINDRWVELRQLRYLVATDDAGNLGRAAERLYVSQPALSYALKNLEAEFGVRLFDRHAGGVTATAAERCARPTG
jgi:hypothetical protein